MEVTIILTTNPKYYFLKIATSKDKPFKVSLPYMVVRGYSEAIAYGSRRN